MTGERESVGLKAELMTVEVVKKIGDTKKSVYYLFLYRGAIQMGKREIIHTDQNCTVGARLRLFFVLREIFVKLPKISGKI